MTTSGEEQFLSPIFDWAVNHFTPLGAYIIIVAVAFGAFFPFWSQIPKVIKESEPIYKIALVVILILGLIFGWWVFSLAVDIPLPNFFNFLNKLYDKWVLGL
jgi:hypothetical protein